MIKSFLPSSFFYHFCFGGRWVGVATLWNLHQAFLGLGNRGLDLRIGVGLSDLGQVWGGSKIYVHKMGQGGADPRNGGSGAPIQTIASVGLD